MFLEVEIVFGLNVARQLVSWISVLCFGAAAAIIISMFRSSADPLSPARIFGLIWSLSVGLTDLKLSGFQHDWSFEAWCLLLIAVGSFLTGTFVAFVGNMNTNLIPLSEMRQMLMTEKIREGRLFWLICFGSFVYLVAFYVNFLVKGWIPILTVGTNVSRVDFNVSGLTLFLYTAVFVIFFTVLYYVMVPENKAKKAALTSILLVVVGSFLLLIIRYPIILTAVICVTFLYYSTHYIRLRTALPVLIVVVSFFYWISSLRFSHVISSFLYYVSKMRFSKDYAFLTEPYMYISMNLENFARGVSRLDSYTFGYFTFDFVTALSGLKYWAMEYFKLDRTPFLGSNYNTYTAFWWFYNDFGVIGLAAIPFLLGLGIGITYYRLRTKPTLTKVALYGIMVFVLFISYFNFPVSFLWFQYNILVILLGLRWVRRVN